MKPQVQSHGENKKSDKLNKINILLGAFEIGILFSFPMPFVNSGLLKANSEISLGIIFYGAPILISLLCGISLISSGGKEAVLKWVFSLPVWIASLIILYNSDILYKMYYNDTQAEKLSYGDAFGWGVILYFLIFWALIFLTAGLCISIKSVKSEKLNRTLFALQKCVIPLICLALVVAAIVLNITLPMPVTVFG